MGDAAGGLEGGVGTDDCEEDQGCEHHCKIIDGYPACLCRVGYEVGMQSILTLKYDEITRY